MKIVVLLVGMLVASCSYKYERLYEDPRLNTIDSIVIEESDIVEDTIVPLSFSDLSNLRIPYIKDIIRSSKTYSLHPELVAGIIKQESQFKHYVRSNRNAIGLMQVVPDKAGQEVNKIFYKKDEPMEDSLLYNPSFNIKVGCAYLSYLRKYFFSGVRSNISRRYCMIAAYNTGAGNVIKALVNESDTENIAGYNDLKGYSKFAIKLKIATDKVNGMSHLEVREHLKNNLPYDETKDYLEKVLTYIDEWKDTANIEVVALNQ